MISGAVSGRTPDIGVVNGRVYVVWAGQDGQLYYCVKWGLGWHPIHTLPMPEEPKSRVLTPQLVAVGAQLHVVWRQAPTPEATVWDLYYCRGHVAVWP